MTIPGLPDDVVTAVVDLVGAPQAVEELGGLSARRVVAVQGTRERVAVKGPVDPPELAVAGQLGQVLRRQGVPLPETLSTIAASDGGVWLVLESLPDPLPRDRWGADPETLTALSRLHSVDPSVLDGLPGRYQPRWDDRLDRAGAILGLGPAEREVVDGLGTNAHRLTEPSRVVSGDPNPLNWRLDASGGVVLVDWERITVASPALDLAIMLPGFPDLATARDAVVRYRSFGGAPVVPDDLLVAKAFTVLELAAESGEGSAAGGVVEQVAPSFRAWLRALAR